MSTAARPLLTVDDFLASAGEREGKWELEDGVLISMSPERLGHGRTTRAAVNTLSAAIQRAALPCEAIPDSVGVRISARTSYQPDALVYCGPRLPSETLEILNPIIVVEVLSPSSSSRDQSVKLAGYFSLPSLVHYLVLAPEARMAIHHKRGAGGLDRDAHRAPRRPAPRSAGVGRSRGRAVSGRLKAQRRRWS
jgi:Uma2 family endonuclease